MRNQGIINISRKGRQISFKVDDGVIKKIMVGLSYRFDNLEIPIDEFDLNQLLFTLNLY